MPSPLLLQYAQEYATSKQMSTALEFLGDGSDGAVWLTSDRTAVKAFEDIKHFETEKSCYVRLSAAGVSETRGFAVPKLVHHPG